MDSLTSSSTVAALEKEALRTIDGILRPALRDPPPADARERVQTVRRRVRQFFEAFGQFEDAVTAVREDGGLSESGKLARLRPLHDEFQASSERAAHRVESLVSRLLVSYRGEAALPALPGGEAAVQGKLANARSDAVMFLRGVGLDEDVTRAMRDLVESSSDPAVEYLMLETGWPETFLRSTRTEALIPVWEDVAYDLRFERADDAGRSALRMLGVLRPLEKVVYLVKAARDFYFIDNPGPS